MTKHFVATQLQPLLSRFGYRLSRYPRCLRHAPSQELSLTIEHCVALFLRRRWDRDHSPVTLLQIGAYPTGQDPLALIGHLPCCLIFVEPQPAAIATLKARHRHDARVQVIGLAIGSKVGSASFYVVDNADGLLPKWSEQLASFNRKHLEKFADTLPGILPPIRETAVTVEPLPRMLSRLEISSVDILLIDTEGHDYTILQQLPLMRTKPSIVLFEHGHLSRHDREASWTLLVTLGYRIAVLGRDTLACLDD